MGGDTFQGVEKLTNEQFEVLVSQLLSLLTELAIRAEVYRPLPEKPVHGDIDLIIMLKPEISHTAILELLKIERYIFNNKNTLNTVYKNKQVDFYMVTSPAQFETTSFYKSYSGLGAYLEMFLSDEGLKLSTNGLYAIEHQGHLHYQLQISTDIQKILQFCGMSFEWYSKGFQTRRELFQFMRSCRFLDQETVSLIDIDGLARRQSRSIGKLTKQFILYLREQGTLGELRKKPILRQLKPNLRQEALKYFKKREQFFAQLSQIYQADNKMKSLAKKFNAKHIIEQLLVPLAFVDKLKKQFKESFEEQEKYLQFIEANDLEIILKQFHHRCQLDQIDWESMEQPKLSKRPQKQKRQKNPEKKE